MEGLMKLEKDFVFGCSLDGGVENFKFFNEFVLLGFGEEKGGFLIGDID